MLSTTPEPDDDHLLPWFILLSSKALSLVSQVLPLGYDPLVLFFRLRHSALVSQNKNGTNWTETSIYILPQPNTEVKQQKIPRLHGGFFV